MRTDRSAFFSEVRSLRNARSSQSLSYARCSVAHRDSSTLQVTCTPPTQRLSLRTKRSAIMVDRYRKKIAAMVIQLAKDDPKFVKEMMKKLKRSGEIEAGDLVTSNASPTNGSRLLRRICRRHDVELGRKFHSLRFRHRRSDLLQQSEAFIGKGVGPPAHLLLDVVFMPDLAQVKPDLSELLDFGRCKACRVA